jgi:GNAT superfamily N-acetyltransferase
MIQVVEADLSNLEVLAPLFDAYRVWYRKPSNLEGSRDFLQERIRQKESKIYLAMDKDRGAVGFVQLYPSFSSTRLRRLWILNDLFVKPSERGKGHSKLLIGRAKMLCKETYAAGLLLETETTNVIGNQLYPAEGFELEKNNFYFWTNK